MNNNFLQAIDTLTIKFALTAVLLPLLAFVFNFLLPGRKSKLAGWVSTVAILFSAVLSALVFAKIWNTDHVVHQQVIWFTVGSTTVYAGVLLNNLSVLMLLLVSVIALPVHIYSTAYMKRDGNINRYFAYLSLFCFSMLALVVVDNLVLFYGFWELVGFSSYLLIGFWFTRDKAVQANKKAFIMNRIGDIGLLTAVIILFTQFHTFDIDKLFGSGNSESMVGFSGVQDGVWSLAYHLPKNVGGVWVIGKLVELPAIWQYVAFGGIFLAVAAKSAQFPLHTWLPDAMEGPTSVSALIHAATMVAAGVFLLARVYPLFNDTELTILAVVGCFTAFMAASIALTQTDLKRILAYSTISQLGYMVMAMGIGAYTSSLFHLVTHAFFKCLLFLVAGIVIHQMQHIKEDNGLELDIDPQNINHMGGLRKKLPFTFIVAVIGGLALIGFPLTSGYLSKDGILIQSFEWTYGRNGIFKLVPIVALLTTWLTAFYVTRLIVKVFFGELRLLRIKPDIKLHLSDGNWQYKLPLALLAVCCFFPLFSINPFSYEQAWIFKGLPMAGVATNTYHTFVPVVVLVVSLLVMYGAYVVYAKRKENPFPQRGILFNLSFNAWYFDSIYNKIIVKPVLLLCRFAFWFDRNVIDGFVKLLAKTGIALAKISDWTDRHIVDGFLHLLVAIVRGIGNFFRVFQAGKVQYYLFSMLVIILALFILKIVI